MSNINDDSEATIDTPSDWFPNDMEIFQHPMCLVSAQREQNENYEEKKNILKIEQKAVEQIQKIDWPMVVVAVVGLYRTGKSYLMNRLADSSKENNSGFALGNSIESTTKGIWAWCRIHPEKLNTVLLLLDTEGLGDVEKNDPSYDNKIFTLAVLLCNCLVYNIKGAFDNDAVAKLTPVYEMSNIMRFRGESPDFVLCLRDFSFKLSLRGKKITENEYLEYSLSLKRNLDYLNKPSECIRKYFPKRECFTFPVPCDYDVLENLETLSFNDLSGKFKEATTRFVSYIYKQNPKEVLASIPVNGQMFVTLLEHYVKAIKHGAVPDVGQAFKLENAKIEKKALEMFDAYVKKLTLPVTRNVLRRFYTEAQQTALAFLRQRVVHDREAIHENQAQRTMDKVYDKLKEENDEKVKIMCESKLQVLKRSLEAKVTNRSYKIKGGYRKFRRDTERLREEYVSVLRDFEENEILWTWYEFVNSMKKTENEIVEADENLSEMEKKEEHGRNEEKIENIIEKQHKVQQEALELVCLQYFFFL